MPISTLRGDQGETDLLFNRRVSKLDPQVISCGEVDELNSLLGVVRAHQPSGRTVELISRVQTELFSLMGKLATHPEDAERYEKTGFGQLGPDHVQRLTEESRALEADLGRFDGWAIPGATGSLSSSFLDLARSVCRRAERSVLTSAQALNVDGRFSLEMDYLNRLSDVLWLLSRWEAVGERK
jgi:cob(I)alamin adenosyltransferase